MERNPMPVIIPPGYCQVTLNYDGPYFASGGGATVLGFGPGIGPDGDDDMLPLVQRIVNSWADNLQALTANTIRLVDVVAVTATQRTQQGANLTGGVGDDTVVPSAAVLESYSTSRRGPRGRGRSYWPGQAFESSTDKFGIMAANQVNGLQGAHDLFWAEIQSELEAIPQVILQGTSSDPARPDRTPPIDPPPIVLNRVVQARLATQRRRLRP